MTTLGWMLMALGVALMAFGLLFDIRALGSFEVANYSLMHQASLLTNIGGFAFVGGAVLATASQSQQPERTTEQATEYSETSDVLGVRRTSFHDHTPIEHMSDGTFRVRGEEDRYASEGDVKSVITARRASPDLRA